MKKSVTGILKYQDKILSIKRQNHLSVFPGYTSFPGGKVDDNDNRPSTMLAKFQSEELTDDILNALIREVEEELGILLNDSIVKDLVLLGVAITPDFNPYRFENFYIQIELANLPEIKIDDGEIESFLWESPSEFYKRYQNADILAVPPTISVVKSLSSKQFDLSLPYCPETEVPMIESMYGVKQFLPLSNTFPPANRTNCFLIGDALIDPSPKDDLEYSRLYKSLLPYVKMMKRIFITHHHPDHFQFSNKLALDFNLPISMSKDCYERIRSKYDSEFFSNNKVEFIKCGDILTKSLQGEDVYVLSVPGHDAGQLAIYPKSKKWFIAGDLFQTVGTVVIGGPEGDMTEYFNSLEKVIKMNPTVIYPSHGIALGGVKKLQQTLLHRKMRESQIIKLLSENKNEDEIVQIVYEGIDSRLVPYALKTVKAHIKRIFDLELNII